MTDLKEAIREIYLKYQQADGLKVGDKVKVLRIAYTHENGWHDSWVEEMDSMVGKTYIVESIGEDGDIFLTGNWGFPYFVLKKINLSTAEYLSYNGTWVKSFCNNKQIDDFAKLSKDKEYQYSHSCDLLYRIKRVNK